MDDTSIRDEIARLEAQIEGLNASIERCAKISIAAKIAVALGLAWLALVIVALAAFRPETIFAALTAAIGGVVLLGSNATTWDQHEAARAAAVAKRIELIDRIALREVGERPTLH